MYAHLVDYSPYAPWCNIGAYSREPADIAVVEHKSYSSNGFATNEPPTVWRNVVVKLRTDKSNPGRKNDNDCTLTLTPRDAEDAMAMAQAMLAGILDRARREVR